MQSQLFLFAANNGWNNGGWAAAGRAPGASYTATDSAKVRLTYTWRRKRGLTLIVR